MGQNRAVQGERFYRGMARRLEDARWVLATFPHVQQAPRPRHAVARTPHVTPKPRPSSDRSDRLRGFAQRAGLRRSRSLLIRKTGRLMAALDTRIANRP